MKKIEYFTEFEKIYNDGCEEKHSWCETIYKQAVLIDTLLKEYGEEIWICNERFYCEEFIFRFYASWNQLSDEEKSWIRKASDLVGYYKEYEIFNILNKTPRWWGEIK